MIYLFVLLLVDVDEVVCWCTFGSDGILFSFFPSLSLTRLSFVRFSKIVVIQIIHKSIYEFDILSAISFSPTLFIVYIYIYMVYTIYAVCTQIIIKKYISISNYSRVAINYTVNWKFNERPKAKIGLKRGASNFGNIVKITLTNEQYMANSLNSWQLMSNHFLWRSNTV